MKKICFLAIIVVVTTAACNPKVRTETVDLNELQQTVTQLANNYAIAWNNENIDVLSEMISGDGLYCGSDPSEQLDKSSLLDMYKQLFSDTITDYSYVIDLRKSKISTDGNSALVMEHLTMADWSPKIKMRQTYQLVKTNDGWEIDYISWSFIVNNDDILKLNELID